MAILVEVEKSVDWYEVVAYAIHMNLTEIATTTRPHDAGYTVGIAHTSADPSPHAIARQAYSTFTERAEFMSGFRFGTEARR